ncbi:hypothetical protein AAC03nite_20270 [Alicyclobacillus acidoterrestris]|nr:hypothetical protein AAC03nite_20270 [Alicyclobacillus acidoterrestris]
MSKKFPAWFLGRNPTKEMIITSYSADLAYDFSRIAKNTLDTWGSQLFGVEVEGAVGRWGIKGKRGGLAAAGVGGPITGRGAHVAIIDDPFKNWQDAASSTIRENVWDWYRSTLRTRLAPKGAIVLVMTRWHEDDLAGRLLEAAKVDGEKWERVDLQAVAEEEDALGRKVGEVLWPERFAPKEYEDMRRAVGSRLWAALYQQRPSPDEGTILKREWWKFYKEIPTRFDEIVQSWDCTFKDAQTSDYVVGQVWGRVKGDYYLLDQIRSRMDITATMQAIRNLSAKWPKSRTKLIEDKANGPAVIQMLNREISGLVAVNPNGGKVVRAQAIAGVVEAGNVYLPDPSKVSWINDFVEECAAFPNGQNDDQVDACTQAINRMSNRLTAIKAPVPVGDGSSYWR